MSGWDDIPNSKGTGFDAIPDAKEGWDAIPDKVKTSKAPQTTEEQTGVVKSAYGTMKNIGKVYPAAEAAATLATSAYGVPASGIAGLAALPFGLDAAKNAVQKTQDALIYKPQTEGGKQLTQALSYPMEKADELGAKAGEKFKNPNIAAAVHSAISASPMLLPIAGKVAGKGVSAALKPIAESALPERIYGSSVKTPLSKKWVRELPGEEVSRRERALTEGVTERIPPSEYGIAKAKRLEQESRFEVEKTLKEATDRGDATIKTDDMLNAGLKKAYEIASDSSDPIKAKSIVDKFREKFLKGHGEEITVKKANDIKRQLYKETSWSGNQPNALMGQLSEAEKKGIAHQFMSELEKRYPELDALNASDGARIDLLEALERSVARHGNTDLLGLGAKTLTGIPKTSVGIIAAIWESTAGHPQVKARFAFALDRARSIAKKVRGTTEEGSTPNPQDFIGQNRGAYPQRKQSHSDPSEFSQYTPPDEPSRSPQPQSPEERLGGIERGPAEQTREIPKKSNLITAQGNIVKSAEDKIGRPLIRREFEMVKQADPKALSTLLSDIIKEARRGR